MADDFRGWPHLLREVAERVGKAEALKLVGDLGGQRITVPTRAERSALAEKIGLPVARVIVDLYGGGSTSIPLFAARRAEARLAAERRKHVLTHPHQTANDLANALGITSRRVEQIREADRAGKRQFSLFDT